MLSVQNNIFHGGLSPIWFKVCLPSDWDLHMCGCTTMCEYVCELGCLWLELCIHAACQCVSTPRVSMCIHAMRVSVYPRVCVGVYPRVCVCACVYCLAVYGFVRPYGVLSGECTTHLALLLALVFIPSVPPPSSLSHPLYFSFYLLFSLSTHLTWLLFDWPTFYFFPLLLQLISNKLYWPSNKKIYTMATL